MPLSEELKSKDVPAKRLFLDPNNPRFSTELVEKVPEGQITEKNVQKGILERLIDESDVKQIYDSIKEIGYLPIDRVVVKPIQKTNNFVVLEGNRRLAAVKSLLEAEKKGLLKLKRHVKKSLTEKIPVVVYEGRDPDAAWVVQGARHLSGIREWRLYQRGKVVYDLKKEGLDITEIDGRLGLGPRETALLYRAFSMFKFAQKHCSLGKYLENDHFPNFHDAAVKTPLLTWLGWDDEKEEASVPRMSSFIWLFLGDDPSAEENEIPISRNIDIKDKFVPLVKSYLGGNKSPLERFLQGDMDIEEAYKEATRDDYPATELDDIVKRLMSLSPMTISTEKERKRVTERLERVKDISGKQLSLIKGLKEGS
jgi:hypothetical protein